MPLPAVRREPSHRLSPLQPQRPRLSQGNPGLLAVPRYVRQLEPINPIGSTTLNRPQHRHSRASCPTKIPKGQGSSERCHLVGNLHLEGATFAWCPVQLKVASALPAELGFAG
jgi:hypothetical protein